jgi:uncharacterized protein with FMN-binding domain
MTKLTRFFLAAALVGAIAIAAANHRDWNRPSALAILTAILLSLVAAAVLIFRSDSVVRPADRKPSGKTISTSLATLSSAAIVAVYAAGYYRTSSPTNGFTEQTERRGAEVTIAQTIAAQPPLATGTVPPPAAPSYPPAAPVKHTTHSPKDRAAIAESQVPIKKDYFASNSSPAKAAKRGASAAEPVAPQISQQQVSDANLPFAAQPAVAAPKSKYKDGTFLGWGSCRHGDIQASVTIQSGKIVSSAITQCLTRYSCSWISNLPGQVVTRQSPEVDYVSGATQSTDAFYGAVTDALSKARN